MHLPTLRELTQSNQGGGDESEFKPGCPRQALEGELHDVEREEQSGHLSQLFVGYLEEVVASGLIKD